MTNELTLTGQWYIPQTHETLSGTLLIIRDKKRIILRLTATGHRKCPYSFCSCFLPSGIDTRQNRYWRESTTV